MECREIRKRLSAYLDGELKQGEWERVANHITSCPDCARELKTLQETCSLLKVDEGIEPSQDFLLQLFEKIGSGGKGYQSLQRARWSFTSVPAFIRLTIVLLLGMVVGVGFGSLTSSERQGGIALTRSMNAAQRIALDNFQSVHPQSLTQAYRNLTSPLKS
jgi:anti-sigma factor RsiW